VGSSPTRSARKSVLNHVSRKFWNDHSLAEAVKLADNFSEIQRNLGLVVTGSNARRVKADINRLGLDTSHFTWKALRNGSAKRNKLTKEALVADSPTDRLVIKDIVIRENLIPYLCSICGNEGKWLGAKLVLILDHINGVNNDHRLENLRFLCPNCNSQQPTFAGGNRPKVEHKCECGARVCKKGSLCVSCSMKQRVRKKKISWPPLEVLVNFLLTKTTVCVAAELGVSEAAVRKHLARKGVKLAEVRVMHAPVA
jgi:5-methylcytosine-specific restriction endonuclease McrA